MNAKHAHHDVDVSIAARRVDILGSPHGEDIAVTVSNRSEVIQPTRFSREDIHSGDTLGRYGHTMKLCTMTKLLFVTPSVRGRRVNEMRMWSMEVVGMFAIIHGLPYVHFASNILCFYNSNLHGSVYGEV
jgi:hypothetical protein